MPHIFSSLKLDDKDLYSLTKETTLQDEFGIPSFLIASPELEDPFFKRSVILLWQTNNAGAYGFVINQASDQMLGDLALSDMGDMAHEVPVWQAGPVEKQYGFVLHRCKDLIQTEQTESPIWLTSCTNNLKSLLRRTQWSQPQTPIFRIFMGYSGWTSEQLSQELGQGNWIQAPYCEKVMFHTPCELVWSRALRSVGIYDISFIAKRSPLASNAPIFEK